MNFTQKVRETDFEQKVTKETKDFPSYRNPCERIGWSSRLPIR
jgi:hypothetical protein